jgi:hypothetical protein
VNKIESSNIYKAVLEGADRPISALYPDVPITGKINIKEIRFLVWLREGGPVEEIKEELYWTFFGRRRAVRLFKLNSSCIVPIKMIRKLFEQGLIGLEWPTITPKGVAHAPPGK